MADAMHELLFQTLGCGIGRYDPGRLQVRRELLLACAIAANTMNGLSKISDELI